MKVDVKVIADALVTKTSAVCFAVVGLAFGTYAFLKYKTVEPEVVVVPKKQDTRDPAEVDREERLKKAVSYVEGKFYKKAEEMLMRLAREMPRNALVFSSLALCQKKSGQFERATENLEKALTLEPGQWALYQNMGVLQYEKGRAGDALRYFERALDLAPGNTQALLSKAKVLETTGHYFEAKASYKKALDTGKIDPELTGIIQDRLKRIEVLAFIEKGEP